MNIEDVREIAFKRMTRIEEAYLDDVPQQIMDYYQLNHLIYVRLIERYYQVYGFCPVDPYNCHRAKLELGFGELSPFEEDSIRYLNENSRQKERDSKLYPIVPIEKSPRLENNRENNFA